MKDINGKKINKYSFLTDIDTGMSHSLEIAIPNKTKPMSWQKNYRKNHPFELVTIFSFDRGLESENNSYKYRERFSFNRFGGFTSSQSGIEANSLVVVNPIIFFIKVVLLKLGLVEKIYYPKEV